MSPSGQQYAPAFTHVSGTNIQIATGPSSTEQIGQFVNAVLDHSTVRAHLDAVRYRVLGTQAIENLNKEAEVQATLRAHPVSLDS